MPFTGIYKLQGKKKKRPHPQTFSNSHYSNFYTLDECHRVTIYPNYQVTLLTGREGHFHHNTSSNFTLILLRNNHLIVNSGLTFLKHFKLEVTDQKTMKTLKKHYLSKDKGDC